MPADPERLQRALNPEAVAVIGDKKASGYTWLRSLSTFTGNLYSVQVDENEIPGIEEMGIANYKSLTEIPERIDFAVCAVPRQVAPFIVQGCVDAEVGGVTLFTSGFAETGEDLGVELQQKIYEIAAPSGLALIGPNCMGVHIPRLGVRFNRDQPAGVEGDIGFVSQSGTHGMNFSLTGAAHGLTCSTMVSFGNGIILEAADYLDYLAADERTRIIGMYIEGARDGRRLFDSLKAAAAKKPTIVWKGGQTEGGGRAIRSHTASLASDQASLGGGVQAGRRGRRAQPRRDGRRRQGRAALQAAERQPARPDRDDRRPERRAHRRLREGRLESAAPERGVLRQARRVLQHHRRQLPEPARRRRHDRPGCRPPRHDFRHPRRG